MRGKVIVSKFWTNLFSARQAAAITIFPFVFLLKKAYKQDKILLNHENIHIVQAMEMLVFPFYVWYVVEFFLRFCYYGNFRTAYLNICFEREAYRNERDLSYLKTRRFWSFWRYL